MKDKQKENKHMKKPHNNPQPQGGEEHTQNVAFFQEDLNDKVVDYGGVTYPNEPTCNDLANDDQSGFFLDQDANNVTDFCKRDVPDSELDYKLTLRRSDNSTYELEAQPFVGTRPPTR